MTDEQINPAIAEACGWIRHHMRPSETERRQKKWRYLSDLPDYLNDLNAMHEAEKTLTENQWSKYVALLTGRDWICDRVITSDAAQQAIHATARQRCIAFLKTKGLIP